MNSKKTFITLGIVVAVLALGIAYAAVNSRTLNVVGNVTTAADDSNFSVIFDRGTLETPKAPTHTGDGVHDAQYVSDNTANLTVSGLTTEGQSVTATYVVKNASKANITADVSAEVSGGKAEWFDIQATLNPDGEIAKDGTSTLTVTVILNKTPVSDEDVAAAAADFWVTITAEPLDNAA